MITLVTRFEAYLLTEKRVSINTFSAYKRDIMQCLTLLAITTDQAVLAIDQEAIRAYLVYLKQLRLGARSVARKLSALRLFFIYLGQLHGIANPLDGIALPKVENRLPSFIGQDEVAALLQAADADTSRLGLRNRVMLYLMYVTGMRVSELIKVQIDDLMFESGFVLVRGKGGKQRHIPLPPSMATLLKEYLAGAHPNVLKQAPISPYLFPITYAGVSKPLSRQTFWGILKDIWARTGIDRPLSPHGLRHSLATHLLKGGADLRSLQLILGHENLTTVQVYTHVETTHLREVYNKKHPRSA
jgi:integrase/recombinase XerD